MMRSKSLAVLAVPAAIAASIKCRDAGPEAYASSADGTLKLSKVDAPVCGGTGNAAGKTTWTLHVDDSTAGHKQTIRGFGAAVTDSTVAVFNFLPADKLDELLSILMTPAGANFSMMRHTIASSDMSADPEYSYDDAGGNEDRSLSSFALGDRGNAMVALLARMRSLQPSLKILGSPWSPPGWMKLNKVLLGNTYQNNLNHDYVSEYAQYFVRYLQAYKAGGVNIDAITIQNEPLNSNPGMPSMYVYADESGNLIQQNVGPALRAAGFDTEIWAYDHNTDEPSYPQTVLDIASQYVNTIAWHCYATNNTWKVLSDFRANNTGRAINQIMTECWTSSEWTSWHQAADYTMGPLQNWAQGAIGWVLGTNDAFGPHLSPKGSCDSCSGLVTVSDGTYNLTVDYYMLAQFSRFIPAGATVLATTGSAPEGTGVQSVASLNPDGWRAVVIENLNANDMFVTLDTQSGETWQGSVPAHAVVTWRLPPAGQGGCK